MSVATRLAKVRSGKRRVPKRAIRRARTFTSPVVRRAR